MSAVLKQFLASRHRNAIFAESKTFFDICLLMDALEARGGTMSDLPPEDSKILRSTHCVHFSEMPHNVLQDLKALVDRVLDAAPGAA